MRVRLILMAGIIALFMGGCSKPVDKDFYENEYGFAFKHCVKNANTPKARLNDIIHGELMIMQNDSVELYSNYGSPDRLFQILDPRKGSIDEFLLNLHIGDSAIIVVPCDSVSSDVAGLNCNSKDRLYFYIKVGHIIQKKELDKKEIERLEREKVEDSILNKYIEDKNWAYKKQESGLYFVSRKQGNGQRPEYGQEVSVNYTVKTLDGKIIDTNIESNARSGGIYYADRTYEPFKFILGDEGVITGWTEGVSLMDKGSSARLVLPSKLAYGDQEYGPIKPNTPLVFEVSLLDFE